MKSSTLLLVSSFLFTVNLAAPADNRLEERQGDVTYTVTCIGSQCIDYPPTTIAWPTSISVPGGGGPKPTTTPKSTKPKTTTTPTTKKTSATSKHTPPSEPPPTKTKPTQKPTKTEGEVGPSSTRCPVPLYYQCGGYYDGVPWTGCTKCVSGAKCVFQNDFYYQCVADE